MKKGKTKMSKKIKIKNSERTEDIKKVKISKISKRELEYYKKKLIEKYNEIIKLQKNNNVELPSEIGDEIDIAEHNLGREVRRELSDAQSNILKLISTALEKIEKKEYGICSRCGKEIPKKRLKAIPWASLCINCQKLDEKKISHN